MAGVKFQDASKTLLSLVQAIQGQEHETVSSMGRGMTRGLFHRDAAGGKRLRWPSSLIQRVGQVLVNVTRLRIDRNDVGVEQDVVSIYAGLFPGQFSENRENDEEPVAPALRRFGSLLAPMAAAPMTTDMTPTPAKYA